MADMAGCDLLLPSGVQRELQERRGEPALLPFGIALITKGPRPGAIHRRHGLFPYACLLRAGGHRRLMDAVEALPKIGAYRLSDAAAAGYVLTTALREGHWLHLRCILTFDAERARKAKNAAKEAALRAEIRSLMARHAGETAMQMRDALGLVQH